MRLLHIEKNTIDTILNDLLKRSPNNYGSYEEAVNGILLDVKENGDQALFAYTKKFDGADLCSDTVEVTQEEINKAYEQVDDELLSIIRKSMENIRIYHEKQRQYSWFDTTEKGTMLGQKVTPLSSVGVYVPGGKAAYPSSVLMNIIPAKVAGVKNICMVTPPGRDGSVTPTTLVAAKEAGADHIYKIGGAQAVAALAYGTESIPKVDKIVGPGNIYVALAKKAVYGEGVSSLNRNETIANIIMDGDFSDREIFNYIEEIKATTLEDVNRRLLEQLDSTKSSLSVILPL